MSNPRSKKISEEKPLTPSEFRNAFYLTAELKPSTPAGPNRWNAPNDGDWLRCECSERLGQGQKVAIVELANGRQALTYSHRVAEGDRIVYPEATGSRTSRRISLIDTSPRIELGSPQSETSLKGGTPGGTC